MASAWRRSSPLRLSRSRRCTWIRLSIAVPGKDAVEARGAVAALHVHTVHPAVALPRSPRRTSHFPLGPTTSLCSDCVRRNGPSAHVPCSAPTARLGQYRDALIPRFARPLKRSFAVMHGAHRLDGAAGRPYGDLRASAVLGALSTSLFAE